MKKKILFILVFITLAFGVYFALINGKEISKAPVAIGIEQNQPADAKSDISAYKKVGNIYNLLSAQPQVSKSAIQPANQKSEYSFENASSVPAMRITFSAGENSYFVDVQDGSAVYDVMSALASTTNFTFKSDYYSGLGYFIKEINGQPNGSGTYWTLYVNGKYSTVGASQRKLQAGDGVEWRYEKQ